MCQSGYKHTAESRAKMRASRGHPDRLELLAQGLQRCGQCREVKPFSGFYSNKSRLPSGITARCKECIKGGPQYRDSRREFAARLRKQYGIDAEDWARKFEAQNGQCAVCRNPLDDSDPNGLHTDHCHTTGRFRGLLCGGCNTAAGGLRDSPANAEALAAYLRLAAE